MQIKEKIQIEREVTVEVICDCCGQSCNTEDGFEYLRLETIWGFSTKKDMEEWSAQICEKCVDEKLLPIIKFKIKKQYSND